MDVERNDVNVNRLFTWGRVYEVQNSEGEVEALVYMRLLGDADVNKARVYALRKSAELRKKLNDDNSDEHLIYIKEMDEMELSDIVNYIVVFSMREFGNNALKQVKVKRPKQPKGDASLEDLEKFQKEVDEYPDKLEEATTKFIKKDVEKLKKYLETQDKETLYKQYKKTLINEFCEQEANRSYRDMEIYLGCYKDDEYKEKFFESLEQFENLDTQIKSDFRAAYNSLNVPMDELKKLRQATQ
jgi:hypothetical protein